MLPTQQSLKLYEIHLMGQYRNGLLQQVRTLLYTYTEGVETDLHLSVIYKHV